ncbi:MAG: rhodanese-like domain-containing protein, partial [Cellulomonadaceae bacterium]|nr:rhodanese-like domain-containing protein [Cellulomonadaceae bacterium]
PHEHRVAAIPGACLLPLGAFTDGTALAQLDPGRPLVVHCASGVRSAQAAHLAHERGFDVVHLAGGIEAWLELAPLG